MDETLEVEALWPLIGAAEHPGEWVCTVSQHGGWTFHWIPAAWAAQAAQAAEMRVGTPVAGSATLPAMDMWDTW